MLSAATSSRSTSSSLKPDAAAGPWRSRHSITANVCPRRNSGTTSADAHSGVAPFTTGRGHVAREPLAAADAVFDHGPPAARQLARDQPAPAAPRQPHPRDPAVHE